MVLYITFFNLTGYRRAKLCFISLLSSQDKHVRSGMPRSGFVKPSKCEVVCDCAACLCAEILNVCYALKMLGKGFFNLLTSITASLTCLMPQENWLYTMGL